jgi:chitinase
VPDPALSLIHSFNCGAAGAAIGIDLLSNPELMEREPVIAFKTAIWFWMTPQAPKPSNHDVMRGAFTPSADDTQAGRVAGYGELSLIA